MRLSPTVFPSAVVILLLVGCQSPSEPASFAGENHSDTLVVMASRLWSSQTYQDFLTPLAESHHHTIHWMNASELTAIELVSALERVDGILLTGGADIHPARYQQPQDTVSCGPIELGRDSLESFLLSWVDQTHLPCLGICRGMQFMNVHGGGTLHAHLPDVLGTDAHRAGDAENQDTTHAVMAIKAVAGIEAGEKGRVVSHHHQGIDGLATTLERWAQSPDGLTEGIRRRDTVNYPCYVGVQWHPERSEKNQPFVEALGEFFIQSMLHDASPVDPEGQ